MFGALRLFLAILVVYTHLGPPHGAALGHHAVFGFYLLSGFLITRILNDLYDPNYNLDKAHARSCI